MRFELETTEFRQIIERRLGILGVDESEFNWLADEIEDFAWDEGISDPELAVLKYMEQY